MITVTIDTCYGSPVKVKISGHDLMDYKDSYSQLCLAVSFLSRTIARYLEKNEHLCNISVDEGLLIWFIKSPISLYAQVAIDILLQGLYDLNLEWPDQIIICINEE